MAHSLQERWAQRGWRAGIHRDSWSSVARELTLLERAEVQVKAPPHASEVMDEERSKAAWVRVMSRGPEARLPGLENSLHSLLTRLELINQILYASFSSSVKYYWWSYPLSLLKLLGDLKRVNTCKGITHGSARTGMAVSVITAVIVPHSSVSGLWTCPSDVSRIRQVQMSPHVS